MSKIIAFTKFQSKLLMRNYKTTAIGFLMPVLMFIIFGNVFSDFDVGTGDFTIIDYLLPAFIPIIIINAVIMIFGQYYSQYEEQGNLLKYHLLGLSYFSISFGMFLATLIFQLVAIVALILTATLTSDVPLPGSSIGSVIIVLILINLYQFSIAFLVFSLTKKSTTYQSIALILFNYQMFLGGLTFPPELFPDVLHKIVEFFNPIYYALIMMRGVWTEGDSVFEYPKELGIVTLITLILVFLAMMIRKKKRAY